MVLMPKRPILMNSLDQSRLVWPVGCLMLGFGGGLSECLV